MANIRVLVVDDHPAMRTTLVRALESEPGVEVVGQAADGCCAVLLAGKLRPDLVLMDVNMPGLDGIEATSRIVRQNPDIKVMGLSIHCFDFLARKMLDAGARAYVLKDGDMGELLQAIEAVCAGHTYVSLDVTASGRASLGRKMYRRLSHAG
jgi:two-component system invasion response regulator UvrY